MLEDNDRASIFSMGCHYFLRLSEGIVVEYENDFYIIWKCPKEEIMKIQPLTKEYLNSDFQLSRIKAGMIVNIGEENLAIN